MHEDTRKEADRARLAAEGGPMAPERLERALRFIEHDRLEVFNEGLLRELGRHVVAQGAAVARAREVDTARLGAEFRLAELKKAVGQVLGQCACPKEAQCATCVFLGVALALSEPEPMPPCRCPPRPCLLTSGEEARAAWEAEHGGHENAQQAREAGELIC